MAGFALPNDIYIGSVERPLYHYQNKDLILNSAQGVFSTDVIGNELPIDTFSFSVAYNPDPESGYSALIYGVKEVVDGVETGNWIPYLLSMDDGWWIPDYFDNRWDPYRPRPLSESAEYLTKQPSPQRYLEDVPYGTAIYWYISGTFFTKGYLTSVERIGDYYFKLTCTSGVGLLDSKMHTGGLYTGQAVKSILSSIIGETFAYNIASSVQNIPVYGHLPYDTARANLHRLLFAIGAVMRKHSASIDYTFTFLGNSIKQIPSSRVSINGSVASRLPATRAEIVEHAYYAVNSVEELLLFDNTNIAELPAQNQLVIFNDPIIVSSLTTTGTLTINESLRGVNYAIVTGKGTMSGKPYTHTKHIATREINQAGTPEKSVRIQDNHLISAVNSRNVARRALNYFSSVKTFKGKLILENERCGDYVQTSDAWGELTQGYLHKTVIRPTSVIGADVEIIDGYISDANGNNYSNIVVLTGSGTWAIPSDVDDLRIVLVGGAQGGQGGYDGSPGLGGVPPMVMGYYWVMIDGHRAGVVPYYHYLRYTNQPPQKGGAAGAGGEQGKVLVIDLDIQQQGSVIIYRCGTGGAGGESNGGAGSAGTATTARIGSEQWTSEDGDNGGYYDPVGKKTYGVAGKKGYAGGNGGACTTETDAYSGKWGGDDGRDGANGKSVAGWIGGKGGTGTGTNGQNYPGKGLENEKFYANGSGGGGAAYGAVGGDGETYSVEDMGYDGYRIIGAKGGDGADALPPEKATYGTGGRGGNGGGGGGNASGVRCFHPYYYDWEGEYQRGGLADSRNALPSRGGLGSIGGAGGDGCIIVYY